MKMENSFNQVPPEQFTEEEIAMAEQILKKEKKPEQATPEERLKTEEERAKISADAEAAEELLRKKLEKLGLDSYSETFAIKSKSDGAQVFDKNIQYGGNQREGTPVYLYYGNTPEELFKIAEEIEKKHPEYRFFFQTDPEGKWMKYTVSKSGGKSGFRSGGSELPN